MNSSKILVSPLSPTGTGFVQVNRKFGQNTFRVLAEIIKLNDKEDLMRMVGSRLFASHAEQSISFNSIADAREFKKCCAILQVAEDADQEQVRQSYLQLAKRFHPDSGSKEASTSKFHEVDEAYKYFQKRFADFRHNRHKIEGEYGLYYQERKKADNKEVDEDDKPKHVIPQHRQYLSYDGVGMGTPYQREKDYQKHRAMKAAANLYDHRIEKLTKSEGGTEETALVKNRKEAKKGATRYGFDRLVEDLIQESMSKGDFDNLSGSGKPLTHTSTYNPHVDFTTHKLNQVLIENGFTPEWILLEKEIRQEIADIRNQLKHERHKYEKDIILQHSHEWNRYIQQLKLTIGNLNSKIDKYNLVVPMLFKQIVGLNLDREMRKVEENFSQELRESTKTEMEKRKPNHNLDRTDSSANTNDKSFLSELFTLFMK